MLAASSDLDKTFAMSSASTFALFRNKPFLGYWLAGLSANFGWQVQLVGASWLMMAMGGSESQVAMVQTTVALPVMLMSLPGGALADLVGQRSLVLWAQSFLLLISLVLATAAYFDALTPHLLLVCTFLIGSGRAIYYPGWQSIVFEFFPRQAMAQAVAVNSANINIARSFGPALGGAIIAVSGAFLAFLTNAAANLSVIFVALRWPKTRPKQDLPPESLGTAVTAGVRYLLLSPTLISVALRSFIFNFAAIGVLALMPLIARDQLGGGPGTLGLLLGAFGIGGVAGALTTDMLRRRIALEHFLFAGHILFGLASAGLAFSPWLLPSVLAAAMSGVGWIYVQVVLNSAAQMCSPRWVLSRSIALYQTFVFGGNALGSFVGGLGADYFGASIALAVPSGLVVLAPLLALLLPIREVGEADLKPSAEWVAPLPSINLDLTSGPILTTVGYRILDEDIPTFLDAMREKRRNRLRDGAARWTLSRDILDPMLWFERFKVANWAAAQRMHARLTLSGAQAIETLRNLHQGPGRPEVHYELVRDPEATKSLPPIFMSDLHG